MGLRPLSDRWMRRIARATGEPVVWAVGNGGYVMGFTTADHRHGWFDLKAYRGVTPGPIWGIEPGCPGQTSCRRLFGDAR